MKIWQAAGGGTVRVEKVFKFLGSGARGAAGTVSGSSHTVLTGIGTNTHPEIDTHIADANPHSGSAASGANSDITTLSGLAKTALNPADATTATVDVATAYDYTITPSGASFTLALSSIPATGIAWSVTIYAINWDGVTVTLPSLSVTSSGSGLSFTSGGGKDRLVVRGNSGPAGEKEFYNLPGNMG